MTLRQKIVFCSVVAIQKRIKKIPAFLDSWLNASEKKYCLARRYPSEPAAARIAAKHALFSLFGVSASKYVLWARDVCVAKEAGGKPYFNFSARFKKNFKISPRQKIHLSIAHERDQAVAWVILEADNAKFNR